MGANHGDVLGQLQAAGLQIDHIEIGRMVRCRVEGDREKRGWYMLHELISVGGDPLVVGSFGIWHGANNNAQKVEIRRSDVSREQLETMRRRMAEDRKRADQARKHEGARAAAAAAKAWAACSPTGECEYLKRKGVGAHGVRFSPSGAMVLPLLDVTGTIQGLQVIRTGSEAKAKGRPAKEFWPRGLIKKGHFHLVGIPATVLLIAEGYATAASLFEATGLPIAVAYDAGNLAPVAAALHKRYPTVKILICADDDAFSEGNAGVSYASTAAVEVGGAWVKPTFADEVARREKFDRSGIKLTDFNDLHALEGLHVVRNQVEARLSELGWRTSPKAAARSTTLGGAGAESLRPIDTLDELLERYALVYGQGGTVFDRQEHALLALSDMRDACVARELHRAWAEHPDRSIVRVREVGFDPGGEDQQITCNLWGGWPTTPVAGKCDKLLDLLRYMCANDSNPEALYQWVLKWIALPIQRPGAKMKSTLVIHGPQGTGKNLFFEALMSIYGHYGRVIDQSAIEDRFNDWASRKLFLIADEVVARSDLYHVKNKLKAFITGEWIRINPKNIAAYDERNHVNMVFLSNEAMPVVLEEDDRRHAVIWTPVQLSPEYYQAVLDELANGGVAALHDYLLTVDLGEFGAGSKPPMTAAKLELIGLSLDSTARFYYALNNGDIPGLIARPSLSEDVYEAYTIWCKRTGNRSAPQQKLINALQRHHKVLNRRERYRMGSKVNGPHGTLMLGDCDMPPGADRVDWLGDHISEFRGAVADYKEATKP